MFCIPGICTLLHKIPMRQELSRSEAAKFAAAPKSAEVEYPLGSFEAVFSEPVSYTEPTANKTPKKRKREDSEGSSSSMPHSSSKHRKSDSGESTRGKSNLHLWTLKT